MNNDDNSKNQNDTTHRTTLGHRADVAESAALTRADPYATGRIFKAIDFEYDSKVRARKIEHALSKLKTADRKFAQQVLNGKSWHDMHIAKSTFCEKLKKVEKALSPR